MIDATADWVGTDDALTLFYTGIGNVLVNIGGFEQVTPGVVLLECTENGGMSWLPMNMTKLGRGMITNCTSSGPASFRGELIGGKATGVRARCQDTQPWQPIVVEMTFAGGKGRHILRGGPRYVIQEVPDLQDFLI